MTTAQSLPVTAGFDAEWGARALARAAEAHEPQWALERRRAAEAFARALPFPNREDELWRRTDFHALEAALPTLDPFSATARARGVDDLPAAIVERLAGEAGNAALVVQRNGDVVLEQTHPELVRQGVVVGSLDRGFREHGARLQEAFGSLLASDYDRYVAIGAALSAGGAFVWVPDGVTAALPIRLFHWLDGAGRLAAPRTVVILGRESHATVIEEMLSEPGESSEAADAVAFHDGGSELFVGDGSKLVYGTLQNWGPSVYHYSNHRARVGGGAELQWIQTVLGGRVAKANSYFDLAGPGASAYVHGFMFGDQRQHFHLHTLQRHLVPHTTSDLLIKCCLKDRARSVYQGLIQVSEGAQRTDAYQANRNLLLSEQARADSIPGLEILANDVRCTHGATIGHVDAEQMYYLQSRGLPHLDAQRLIVEGFFAPVLDRIPLESVRDQLRGVIRRKIG
ncbi:MAG TPA: Fe-S cluster assembly protein SufD [Candidatus Eisenbacteria bacterium]|jgi:Fe-S cluster assembly protein SufD